MASLLKEALTKKLIQVIKNKLINKIKKKKLIGINNKICEVHK